MMQLRPGLTLAEYERLKEQDPVDPAPRMFVFAEAWAEAMEAAIASGARLEDCAESTARLTYGEGHGEVRYGFAVAVLAAVWVHGEPLRLWHKTTKQRGTP